MELSRQELEVYFEEYRRIIKAASILCAINRTRLNPTEVIELEQLKRKYLGTKYVVLHSSPPSPLRPTILPDLNDVPTYNPPDVPLVPALEALIGRCSKPFEKQLTPSDVNRGQSRLVIHRLAVVEFMKLLNEGESLPSGIPVTVYDVEGKEFAMEFKVWASKFHVLTAGWKAFCDEENLIEFKDSVTLWMFRHLQTQKICFVITPRRVPDAKATTKKRKATLAS